MIIYTTEDGLTKMETIFDGDTVWLSRAQMAELFQWDRSVVFNASGVKDVLLQLFNKIIGV